MNYGELQQAISDQIGRSPSPLAYSLAQADIAVKLKIIEMEKTATLTPADIIPKPTDFRGAISMYINRNYRLTLEPTTIEAQSRANQLSGTPQTFAVTNEGFTINPPANTDDDIILTYWASPLLVNASDTNDILTNHPNVYVYAVLTHHAGLIRDVSAAQTWSTGYTDAIVSVQSEDSNVRFAGGATAPVVGFAP